MEEKKELQTIPFGTKLRVGNFTVLKYTKSLKKAELKALRNDAGIPEDTQKHLQRGGLPFIKVEAISGIWAIEFCIGTTVYKYIDEQLCDQTMLTFLHLFTTWFTDTATPGDEKYLEDKARAMADFMERIKARKAGEETAEEKAEDDKILEEVKASEEAKANILDMAQRIKEGGQDDE